MTAFEWQSYGLKSMDRSQAQERRRKPKHHDRYRCFRQEKATAVTEAKSQINLVLDED